MSIWFNKHIKIEDLLGFDNDNLAGHLGMQFTEIGPDYLKATMPVDQRTIQPYGLLHGGASVALAETIGSIGAALVIDPEQFICVGQEINANHLRPVRSGKTVTGIAKPLHMGSTSHVWDIKIYDEEEKLICVSRITVAILKKR